MPVEAELTAVLRNPAQVRAALAGRADPEITAYADTYYDRPDHSLDAAGYELRVRTITMGKTAHTVLTYKQPSVTDWGAKPEHETTIADAEVLRTIFTGLGLVELIAFRKDCENYRFTAHGLSLVATVVQIPELDGQTFLELETMAEPDDLPAAHRVLQTVLDELGVGAQDLTTESYTDRVAASRRA
ncbi:MAG TPA: class IV adenylate cyclase [Actinophytocola sp.]|uniref:class IV adenylate cyclase n=1 Tax=Actinophytocola sp. TaxID=1872138 RepID=UPI002DB9C5E3|nr:class IV adenylate cyclase [Actinophytocola sp.]HEU5469531.1 class IV adenylate cyclase [Actinophytocola sp.]